MNALLFCCVFVLPLDPIGPRLLSSLLCHFVHPRGGTVKEAFNLPNELVAKREVVSSLVRASG